MEPPLRPPVPKHGLRSFARAQPGFSSTSPSSASPASSVPDVAPQEASGAGTQTLAEALSPHSTVGQFSYAPATQTTVVTTTTTTTTSFPPLILKAPRHLNELDPKRYPLASSPTPQMLKNVCFDFGGTPTCFREADNASAALDELKREHAALNASDGTVRTVMAREPRFETPRPHAPTLQRSSLLSGGSSLAGPSTRSRKRPTSPISISDAVELAQQQRSGNKRRNVSGGAAYGLSDATSQARHTPLRRSDTGATTLNTPSTADRPGPSPSATQASRPQRQPHRRLAHVRPTPYSPDVDQQDSPSTLSPHSGPGRSVAFADDEDVQELPYDNAGGRSAVADDGPGAAALGAVAAATPPIADTDLQPVEQGDAPASPRHRPAMLNLLDAASSQDASLPSPSLSPVTAALHHGHHGDYFGQHADDDVESGFELPPLRDALGVDAAASSAPASGLQDRKLAIRRPGEASFSNRQLPSPTLMEIPSMLDSFDAMPTEMQTYLMYQFLRRCSKPTLQFVAGVVNPALKCDFLALLPLELSLNIIRCLDFQSMCRAAQVSRKWRQIVDSDEKAWKELFDRDGYALPEGELQQAIREGWGWQHPHGRHAFERDISAAAPSRSDSESSSSFSGSGVSSATDDASAPADATLILSTPQSGRPKRKAAAKYSSRKQPRRRERQRGQPDKESAGLDGWMSQLSVAEGPYAAATAAAVAVPNPTVGLASLRNLHLHKSIYRRHHAIKRGWMEDATKPRHIAFRAHQRHVVTCLQFDTDKILTGSDDTNINVYDTRTGALRSRLEGHEGGVWALQYEGNVLVSGSTDRSVRVWDIERGVCTQVFQGHTSTVRCLQILMPAEVGRAADGRPILAPKQPLIITGSRDSNLRVWRLPQPGDKHYVQAGPPPTDVDCPYFVRTLSGHHHSVRAIAAHADTLVSGSYDCTVRVWRISTGETVHRLQGHTQKVYSVVLDHARNRCISGSMDNLVKVWSLDTGAVLYNLEGHTSLVGLLDLSHDRLVSAAADSTLRIWDPESGQWMRTLSAHTGAITCFQHDGQKVISGSDRTLKMWDVRTGECVRDLLTDLSGVWQVKFNERRCVAAVQRKNLTYIEVLDFGASRDGFGEEKRGRRIVVNARGQEIPDVAEAGVDETAVEE
ncbi:MAG: SCF ubiquitin ligase complex subunit cdc4 [Thelocarpon impressellum]|nr:MAG: SCF ubiquitin ligase complex subunit cdc4 [Thelocarpon impressellum]